ncbi:head maturation protease, ClpP-related [Paraliobacillus zengyii]|uniref:head maturation protease, ClpP-related n=1 Tax=Paraliobacillus zengyii TaxID=2213194 RepID=UPI000DD493C5|nr:head maturation protease, ClpP-related [Paraliobacillus zengyii]
MTVKINVRGAIIGNDFKEVYDFYDMESTCPNDISDKLPKNQEQVEVVINSGGGHIDAGSEIYYLLKDYKGKVTVKIAGMAASAASVIAMSGDHVIIVPTAQMMIHNVSSIAQGDYNKMLHESDVLKEMNRSIANAYILKTGKLEKEILDLMNKETWLSAKSALQQRFVDEIMGVSSENVSEFLVASSYTSNLLPYSVIEKYRDMKSNNRSNSNHQTNSKKNVSRLFMYL